MGSLHVDCEVVNVRRPAQSIRAPKLLVGRLGLIEHMPFSAPYEDLRLKAKYIPRLG